MNTLRSKKLMTMLLVGALAVMTPQWAMALTPACTAINNTATINYKVGTVDQDPVSDAAPEFVVGNKVNLTVTTSNTSPGVTVLQGDTGKVLTFTVTNTGNYTQDYSLTASDKASSTYTVWANNDTIDNFSADSPIIWVETNGTAGLQTSGGSPDTQTATINDLDPTATVAPDTTAGTRTVYIVAAGPVPLQSNGDKSAYSLKATTLQADGTAIPAHNGNGAVKTTAGVTACTTDFVYGDDYPTDNSPEDGSSDGQSSAMSAFVVSASATLTVEKTSAVYSDPINGTSTPKAIPGAVVTYTITITNPAGSSATASSVSISDSLNAEITASPSHLVFGNNDTANSPNGSFKDGATDCTGVAGQGIVVDGVCKTNVGPGGDLADWNVTAGNTVTVTGLSLAPNTSKVIKFQVTIQ